MTAATPSETGGAARAILDRALLAAAAAYFAVVAWGVAEPSLRASADALGDGRVWLLLTSALNPQGAVPLVQVAITAAVAGAVIVRAGAARWWAAALAGHVGSALIAYGAIGIAAALGSASADRAGARPDFGVSCVLGASAGALLGGGARALRDARRGGPPATRGDRLAATAGAVGLLAALPASLGWYASEHVLSVLLGAAVGWAPARARRT